MERSLNRKKQSGFALVASVFLIVILALAATFMARISGAGYASQAQHIISNRVRQAALAAVEHAIYQAAVNGTCLANEPLVIAAYSNLQIFSECQTDVYQGGISIYRISGSASNGSLGQLEYVWRQYHASIEL